MTTQAFVQFQGEMTRERLKQEAALIVLDRLMQAVAGQVLDRFKEIRGEDLTKSLSQFEEHRSAQIGRLAESIAERLAIAIGPDSVPMVQR